ncbi:MAG: DUF1553 domain-containing protein [Candidatus Hydrogenedentes bacterium]|nr:DUF1553 domain-containing protein [Candidatus Hydrogenedentota bacterium]
MPHNRFRRIPIFRCLLAMAAIWGGGAPPTSADPLEYNRDIRPILSRNCFNCHGPDSAARKAGLRLDDRDAALAERAIVPGDPDASALVARIFADDANDLMPPPESKLGLTDAQKDTLRRWIAEGAAYEPHWAFQTPSPPDMPQAPGAPTAIDAFIRARLAEEGLSPAPEAPKETLIRRVALDLTGLPPTLEEIDAFLADTAPDAYERMVDSYLNRPAYAEHMAARWMDVARYADTYGYQNDKETSVWPWRDWVIRAYADNMPFDAFARWQIAGDLLPNPTQDQRLATAFNRLHRQTNEGGSVLEEFRVAYVSDRMETFATAFLGMTMNCAKCHDHKYDPISQRNYYELSAFFSNIDESGMYSHFTNVIPSPSMHVYADGEKERHDALLAAIEEREAALEPAAVAAEDRLAAWRADPNRDAPAPAPVIDLPLDAIAEGKTPNAANAETQATLSLGPEPVAGPEGQALRFNGDNGVDLEDIAAAFDRHQPLSFSLWLKTPRHAPRYVVFHRSMAAEDAANRGYEFMLLDGKPTFSLCHFWPGNAIQVQALEPLPEQVWTHCAITYDGSSRAAGVAIYINGEPIALDVVRDNLKETLLYEGETVKPPLQLAKRFRDNGFKGGQIDAFQAFNRRLTPLEVAHVAGRSNIVAEADHRAGADAPDAALREYYLHAIDTPYREALATLQQARQAEQEFIAGVQEIMIMEEMAEVRPAYFLERGEYHLRGEEVRPATPEAILPMDGDLPRNRLGLAGWLFDPDNPLAARVAVNRLWTQCFGQGLVKTQEDFGVQGALPSHPELLDYLAVEYRESGWDTRAMLKRIVMSAAYRQDSRADETLRDRDPENTLLARGPRHRLSAEQIRDHALASSGLLVAKAGGPSAKPYQPDGLWREVSSASYTPDTGDGLYRRSMYTFIKRTMPPPSLLAFNATNREVCVMRRETTVTPMQALVLLNDPQYIEAARVLAADVLAGANTEEAIRAMFRRLTSRVPDSVELEILTRAFAEQEALFAAEPDGARAYISTGEKPAPEGADPARLAAATAVAQAIMNHEEFQVKQ